MHVKCIALYVGSRTSGTTSSANQSFTFPTVFLYWAKCEKLLSGHTNNALYWSLLRHDQASMLRLPASKKCYSMTSGSLALLQIDLWAVKDGQINIFCILDRIRVSGTCSHLHIALTYHIAIVLMGHFNRLRGGFLPLHPTIFPQLCWFNRARRNHTSFSDFFQLQFWFKPIAASVVVSSFTWGRMLFTRDQVTHTWTWMTNALLWVCKTCTRAQATKRDHHPFKP